MAPLAFLATPLAAQTGSAPVADTQPVALPAGFEYAVLTRTGAPMSDGTLTPRAHDGMAAFRIGDRVHLVRNHEKGNGTPFAPSSATYDPTASGGTHENGVRAGFLKAFRNKN